MYHELHIKTQIPRRIRRIGHLPACLVLDCHDLGEAELEDGSIVTITWGANADYNCQKFNWSLCVFNGSDDGSAELIIDARSAAKLRSILSHSYTEWRAIDIEKVKRLCPNK